MGGKRDREIRGGPSAGRGYCAQRSKKILWHTTFGVISVFEQEFRKPGKRFRPFSRSAGISCRCCSLPLRRAVTDFGADHAFGRVPEKLKEHYGITLPAGTVRSLTPAIYMKDAGGKESKNIRL